MANLKIDVDVVGSNVNRISQLTSDISTRTQKLAALIEEKSNESNNSLPFLTQLQSKLEEEKQNIDKLIEAQDEIKRALVTYADNLAEIVDAGEFN